MARFTQSGGEGGAANTGDITFNGVQIIGAGTASSDGLSAGTMQLVPDAGLDSDQYLIIDPTAPNHIHIRPGGTIDASTADLIMGGENTNLLVSDTGDYVDIRTTSSESFTNVWRFSSDGLLVGPSMGSVKVSGLYNNPGADLYVGSADGVVLSGTDGEFLNDSTNPDNQIATIGDINAARFGASASFFSTVDQGPFAEDTIQAFSFNNTDWATGVSLASTNRVTMTNAGKYNIAFSGQVRQTQSSGNVYIWLNKNGTPIANTNTKVAISSSSPYSVAAWNFFVDAAAGDYYQLMWSSDSEHTVIEYEAATGSGATLKPAIPSIILTVNQVG